MGKEMGRMDSCVPISDWKLHIVEGLTDLHSASWFPLLWNKDAVAPPTYSIPLRDGKYMHCRESGGYE